LYQSTSSNLLPFGTVRGQIDDFTLTLPLIPSALGPVSAYIDSKQKRKNMYVAKFTTEMNAKLARAKPELPST